MLRAQRICKGINTIRVTIIAINAVLRLDPKKTKDMINAATLNATPKTVTYIHCAIKK